jgi:hypothetical protein
MRLLHAWLALVVMLAVYGVPVALEQKVTLSPLSPCLANRHFYSGAEKSGRRCLASQPDEGTPRGFKQGVFRLSP